MISNHSHRSLLLLGEEFRNGEPWFQIPVFGQWGNRSNRNRKIRRNRIKLKKTSLKTKRNSSPEFKSIRNRPPETSRKDGVWPLSSGAVVEIHHRNLKSSSSAKVIVALVIVSSNSRKEELCCLRRRVWSRIEIKVIKKCSILEKEERGKRVLMRK